MQIIVYLLYFVGIMVGGLFLFITALWYIAVFKAEKDDNENT